MTPRYTIEILNKCHDRHLFFCGVAPLDHYLKKQAGQEARKRVAITYLLIDLENDNRIAGYYTLSATSVIPGDLPENAARKLPRYESIPATLIGRLAIDENNHGQRLGKVLLIEALRQSLVTSQRVASFAVAVDAKSDKAKAFYKGLGFIPFPSFSSRLFLPMKSIEALFLRK